MQKGRLAGLPFCIAAMTGSWILFHLGFQNCDPH